MGRWGKGVDGNIGRQSTSFEELVEVVDVSANRRSLICTGDEDIGQDWSYMVGKGICDEWSA